MKSGPQAVLLRKFEAIRGAMTSDDRTPAEGALGWLLARSPNMIPIPGFKTVQQVEQNAGALLYGILTRDQMREIDEIMAGM